MYSSRIPTFHAFSTRFGGVSQGDFCSLNLGSGRGDNPEAVRENYSRWCELFGAEAENCCVTKQVHGNAVQIVSFSDRHIPMSETPYDADGIVTGEKNLPIFCFTADCVPVLLYDMEGHSVGAIHCGWKSSVADILKEAVDAMAQLGTVSKNIVAALGPSIGKCCFETDADVPEAISRYLSGDTSNLWTLQRGKYYVDLRAANARRLNQLGVKVENIDISAECTMCSHDKYWSARYCGRHGKKRGNLSAGIVLR